MERSGPVAHKNLRTCERHLRQEHADCRALDATRVYDCACGRKFVHVAHDVGGRCFWSLVRGVAC